MNTDSNKNHNVQIHNDLELYKFEKSANSNSVHKTNDVIANLAMFTIKWQIIVNGSACVALLALIGNTWGKESKIDFLETLLIPIGFMGLACVFAIIDAIFIYFVFGNISLCYELDGQILFKKYQNQDFSGEVDQRICKGRKAKIWKKASICIFFVSLAFSFLGGVSLVFQLCRAL